MPGMAGNEMGVCLDGTDGTGCGMSGTVAGATGVGEPLTCCCGIACGDALKDTAVELCTLFVTA